MTLAAFSFTPTQSGTELRLIAKDTALPVEQWPIVAPADLLPGVDRVNGLIAADQALADDDMVLIDHAAIAALSPHEAAALGLPAQADALARVGTQGVVTSPTFRATLTWCRPTGQPLVGAERIGAWLRVGGRDLRLSSPLFALAQAVDAIGTASTPEARLLAIGQLRECLPGTQETGAALLSGLPLQIDVVQADAFSLDLIGEGTSARLLPILHRAGSHEPLLPSSLQDAFGQDQFNRFHEARPIYALPGGTFLVLSPVLRRALSEVRRHQASPIAVKRAILAAPRRHLRVALEADDDPTLLERIEDVFVETLAYSDRVIGLGLWEKRTLPWLARTPVNWFSAVDAPLAPGSPPTVPLDAAQAAALRDQIRTAMQAGEAYVPYHRPGALADAPPIPIPANQAQLDKLTKIIDSSGGAPKAAPVVLLILTNENEVEHEQDFVARPDLSPSLPICLETPLKPHQSDGLRWLQDSWQSGAPGVLLADDMGLGKTLQGLAFLAWLREAMERRVLPHLPMLIVAPTGLLANWSAEHDRHLNGMGLGNCLPAFGAGLRALRSGDGTELDRSRLASAHWVLTTYETLRDHSTDFGAVRFGVLLADEAQKVKTPGVRMTDALKGMQADFRIAMTGTPVENRLADLWCIVDGVRPGCLGSLEAFSRNYEASADVPTLRQLRRRLDEPFGPIPPLLLRRMKEDHLKELPTAQTHVGRAPMPGIQQEAYTAVLNGARNSPGSVLQSLQRFRAISLHPDPSLEIDDAGFIAASARLIECFTALDSIAAAGERALLFLDNRELQPRLAGIIQRRYRMSSTPEIINGSVPGGKRQARVDRFQAAPEGFDVMVMSPRAGGVGLTLTRANHVIHLDRWWNPAVEDQCTGRALRIGQTRTVHVHIPIATQKNGQPSFDENLNDLLSRKRQLTRDVLLPGEPDALDAQDLFARTVAT